MRKRIGDLTLDEMWTAAKRITVNGRRFLVCTVRPTLDGNARITYWTDRQGLSSVLATMDHEIEVGEVAP